MRSKTVCMSVVDTIAKYVGRTKILVDGCHLLVIHFIIVDTNRGLEVASTSNTHYKMCD